MSSLRYVYGIARASEAARVAAAGLTGIDEGALLAAASDVAETDYGEVPLNEHVRDLDWLAARAAQHQVVNGRLLELLGTVLPLSFGAIYRDDDGVRAIDAQIAASPPGRAFLLDKQRGTTLSRSTERRDNEAAAAALAELESVAERTYREPVAAGGTDTVALRASVLVAREREPALVSAIGELESRLGQSGYRVRASGPW